MIMKITAKIQKNKKTIFKKKMNVFNIKILMIIIKDNKRNLSRKTRNCRW